MNENINKPKGGNVYLTINSENKIIDILKSTAGIEGFRAFIDRNVERVMNKDIMPNAWMILYEAPDLDRVAILMDRENNELQIKFSDLAFGNAFPKLAMTMKGALYCRKYGLDPMTVPMAELSDTNEQYRTFKNNGIPLFPEEKKDFCIGVETEKGVVLFSRDSGGYFGYLQYLADKFYESNFEIDTLRIYDLYIPPDKIPKGIDLCFDYDNPVWTDMRYFDHMPEYIYVDKNVLQYGYCVEEFDMRATQDNFWEYIPLRGENDLAVLGQNYNISALQFIQQNGYQDDIANNPTYPGYFRYTDRFAVIADRINASQDDPDKLAALKKAAGELASTILDNDFPYRRKSTCVVPEMQQQGLMQYCDRDAFEALVRIDAPRHVPSVTPKKNNGQTL